MKRIQKNRSLFKKFISTILALVMVVTGVGLVNSTQEANADNTDIEMTTLYFIDNTAEKWIEEDGAVIQLGNVL